MRRTLACAFAATALALGATVATAAGASAAHCLDPAGTTPGFAYFGTTHVQLADHAEGGNPGPHAGTSGASSCRDTTGSPAERAPGRG